MPSAESRQTNPIEYSPLEVSSPANSVRPLEWGVEQAEKIARCEEMLETLREYGDVLKRDAGQSLIKNWRSFSVREYERLVGIVEREDLEGIRDNFFDKRALVWPETIIEHIAQGGEVQIEVRPVGRTEKGYLYPKTKLILAGLLQTVAGRSVRLLDLHQQPTFVYEKQEEVEVSSLSGLRGRRLGQFAFNGAVDSQAHCRQNPVEELLRILDKVPKGETWETTRATFFAPFSNYRPSEDSSYMGLTVRLRNIEGVPDDKVVYAAHLMDSQKDQLHIAIGGSYLGRFYEDVNVLLGALDDPPRRQNLIYECLPTEVVVYGVAKLLEISLETYLGYLRKDQSFKKMLTSHPSRYVDINYGTQVEHYPEGIFPGDIQVMEWLMERRELIMPPNDREEIVYTNIGNGAFSWLNLLFAKYATTMELIDPADPVVNFLHKWRHRNILSRYDVGPKFEKALVRRDPSYRDSDRILRGKAIVHQGDFRDLGPGTSDISVESFVKYAICRDEGSYRRNTYLQARSLRRAPTSRMVEVGFLRATGWHNFPYPAYPLTESSIISAQDEAGLKILDMHTIPMTLSKNEGIVVLISGLWPKLWKPDDD